MNEPFLIFKDFDACLLKCKVTRTGQAVDDLLVRNMRSDDSNINATFGSIDEGVGEFVVNDEIWGCYSQIFFCLIDDIEIDIACDIVAVKITWAVSVGADKSISLADCLFWKVVQVF